MQGMGFESAAIETSEVEKKIKQPANLFLALEHIKSETKNYSDTQAAIQYVEKYGKQEPVFAVVLKKHQGSPAAIEAYYVESDADNVAYVGDEPSTVAETKTHMELKNNDKVIFSEELRFTGYGGQDMEEDRERIRDKYAAFKPKGISMPKQKKNQ